MPYSLIQYQLMGCEWILEGSRAIFPASCAVLRGGVWLASVAGSNVVGSKAEA